MKPYNKIQSLYKRDTKGKIILEQWSRPEIEYLAGNEWSFAEKIDGTNIRIMWDGERVRYGGRTDNSQIPVKLLNVLQDKFESEEAIEGFKALDGPVCLYGEGCGQGIQKGGGNYKPDGNDFILFDVNIGGFDLIQEDVVDVGNKLGVAVVPYLGMGTLYDAIVQVESGLTSEFGSFLAEGIVAKPLVPILNRNGERIMVKIKTKDLYVKD